MVDALPLFPLGTVLFPGVVLPLRIFEERYRLLVRDLLESTGPQRFGVVPIKYGSEVGEPLPQLHEVGCVAEVRHIDGTSDGRYDVVTTGGPRFRLLRVDDRRPYLVGEVEYLPEAQVADGGPLAARVSAEFRKYVETVAAIQGTEADLPELPDDPALLSYLVAAATILDVHEKCQLLAQPDAASRLRTELSILRREIALLPRAPVPADDESPFSLN